MEYITKIHRKVSMVYLKRVRKLLYLDDWYRPL